MVKTIKESTSLSSGKLMDRSVSDKKVLKKGMKAGRVGERTRDGTYTVDELSRESSRMVADVLNCSGQMSRGLALETTRNVRSR